MLAQDLYYRCEQQEGDTMTKKHSDLGMAVNLTLKYAMTTCDAACDVATRYLHGHASREDLGVARWAARDAAETVAAVVFAVNGSDIDKDVADASLCVADHMDEVWNNVDPARIRRSAVCPV